MATRRAELQEVRRLLGRPMHQRPDNDLIVGQLLRQEQLLLNKLNNTAQGWTVATTSVTTVEDQESYDVAPEATAVHGFGKALFVYRDLGNGDIMPVPMTDFTHELHDQMHEFWYVPPTVGDGARYRSEKVAFFRTAPPSQIKMRIYPVPDEADVTYNIAYAAGELDASQITMGDVPILPEWSNVRTIEASLYLLPYTEWDGLKRQENTDRRKEIGTSLMSQVTDFRSELQGYIFNLQHEPITDCGPWWE